MKVYLLTSEAELPAIVEVLLELRPQYSQQSLIEQIKKQQKLGYQIAYVKSATDIVCVAGFVLGEKLAWGKHIYIDDLVTSSKHRSTGVGVFFLDWLKAYALQQGCEQIHLDSGVQRFEAHRFYLRNGFNIASHHFSIVDAKAR